MKQSYVVLIVILSFLIILGILLVGPYNGMVNRSTNTAKMWANVESQYQRRLDLIPNLVNTVKGVANFEQKTLTDVIQARASATQVKVDANNLNPDEIAKFQQAQGAVSSSLSRLLVTVEQYPDLKATQNFTDLQRELAGTENRINKARDDFNSAVQDYDSYIMRFPNNLTAGMFGFKQKGYFQAEEAASKAPTVNFGSTDSTKK